MQLTKPTQTGDTVQTQRIIMFKHDWLSLNIDVRPTTKVVNAYSVANAVAADSPGSIVAASSGNQVFQY
jgi:hypothetical protein